MSSFIRPAMGVLCLGVLALGTFAFDLSCLPTLPHYGDPNPTASMVEEMARHEQMEQHEASLYRQRQAKRRVVAEVIARRQSLAEAIEQFRALDQEWPEFPSLPQTPEDLGIAADEWSGRDVLYFVQQILADRPDEAAAVVGRLEKELQQILTDRKKQRPEPENPRIKLGC
jgi:hypothetical protein